MDMTNQAEQVGADLSESVSENHVHAMNTGVIYPLLSRYKHSKYYRSQRGENATGQY